MTNEQGIVTGSAKEQSHKMAAEWLLQVYSTMVEAEEMGENV